MNRIHLSETIFQLYFLFDFEDSNEFIIWQFMDYFQCHDLDIPDLTVSEMYLSQNSLLKSFLQHDLFYVVIYKIHKIQECLSLSGLKNGLLTVFDNPFILKKFHVLSTQRASIFGINQAIKEIEAIFDE